MEISNYTAVRAWISKQAGLEARYVRIKRSVWSFLAALFVPTALFFASPSSLAGNASTPDPRTSPTIQIQGFDVEKQKVTVIDAAAHQPVNVVKGENVGAWTLMAVTEEPEGPRVFEELADRRGSIIYVGKRGVVLNLPKSLEPTSAAPGNPLSRADTRRNRQIAKRHPRPGAPCRHSRSRLWRRSGCTSSIARSQFCRNPAVRRQTHLRLRGLQRRDLRRPRQALCWNPRCSCKE